MSFDLKKEQKSLKEKTLSNPFKEQIAKKIAPFVEKVEKDLQEYLLTLEGKGPLYEPLSYALLGAGKRFRPALVWMIAEGLSPKEGLKEAALAAECFHTASLIADDLPCMDDEKSRRGRPALHQAYDEATAILTSYALIAEGYRLLTKGSPERCRLAVENASQNSGLEGASTGQYLDLYEQMGEGETLQQITRLKTVSLFEISFVFGWLFGGGTPSQLESVKKAAMHFGMAFQIADDLEDEKEDLEKEKKANAALHFGKDKAIEMFHVETKDFIIELSELGLQKSPLYEAAKALQLSSN